jgi:hypothetical protein
MNLLHHVFTKCYPLFIFHKINHFRLRAFSLTERAYIQKTTHTKTHANARSQPHSHAHAHTLSKKDTERRKAIILDGRCGVVVRILAYYARGRGFDSRTVQTFVCMNMSVCIRSVFTLGCMYLQKKCI